jgi:sigma-E factor negative regulatory protein RseB
MRAAIAAVLMTFGSLNCHAGDGSASMDAMAWLKKIAAASRHANYHGTFIYQRGNNQMETSRIVHIVDAGGEYEKLETLDGPPREIIRNNDNVTCYLPESRTVVIEKRGARRFPAMLPDQLSGIADNYVVKKGEQSRVAGYDCQIIELEPRDNLRYGHRYCAERTSGLLLRARIYNENNQMIESFAFSQLAIGAGVSRDMLKSRYSGISQSWRVDKSALDHKDVSADSGWTLKNQPVGFKKLTEMKRSIAGRTSAVSHIVYSDGLAAVSVFIEPLPKSPPPFGPTFQGAVNIFVRSQADQMVTVVGEAPARTVRQIAESLNSRDP